MFFPALKTKTTGLVDHDTRLRHSLLGALLFITMCLICAPTLYLLLQPGPLDLRAAIPSLLLFVGMLVQFQLWRLEKDELVAWVVVVMLTTVTIVGSTVNGLRAPSTIGPLLTVMATGYLLGKRAAWIVGTILLTSLLGIYMATKWGLLATIQPPQAVLARVIAIQLVSSATTLLIPLRGLFSGVKLIEQEKIALEQSMIRLDQQRTLLAQEVENRTRELETANSDLAGFAYTLSNDLRAPLRSIESYIRLLDATEGLDPRQRRLVQRIHELSASLDLDIDTAVYQAKIRQPQ